jgi:hypothetical protein
MALTAVYGTKIYGGFRLVYSPVFYNYNHNVLETIHSFLDKCNWMSDSRLYSGGWSGSKWIENDVEGNCHRLIGVQF